MSTSESDYRYLDQSLGMPVVQVLPGECYVTQLEEAVVTVLGSCIAVCMRDPVSGAGGMNHFLLPENNSSGSDGERYGTFAMKVLFDNVVALAGTREGLETKIFGGGNILNFPNSVGDKNIEFVRAYFEKEGLEIASEDIGGNYSRKIRYFPSSGKVQVKRLENVYNKRILTFERELAESSADGNTQSEEPQVPSNRLRSNDAGT